MSILSPASSASSRPDAAFQSTLWSQVRAAGRPDAPDSRQALETLCRAYWNPVHAFLRRCGHDRQQAKDLTQGFFAYLLAQSLLEKATPERGRFRSFLLGSLKFFVSNQRARDNALKRGGGACLLPLDADRTDGLQPVALCSNLTPERLFERKWALTVIGQAMDRLASEYRRAGLAEQFALLQPHLTGDAEEQLPALALSLGKNTGATRALLFRLRNRFRRLIRAVIADTVADLDQVESELRHLEATLRDV